MTHLSGCAITADTITRWGRPQHRLHACQRRVCHGRGGRAQNADNVIVLADGNGELAAELGLELDGSVFGQGTRSQRFAMIIKDGKVTHFNIEETPGVDVSSAKTMKALL